MFPNILLCSFVISLSIGGAVPYSVLAEDVPVSSAIQTSRECSEGYCFPSTIRIGDSEVPLRNIARKRYFVFDLYMAALYALPEVKDPNDILQETPKRLVLRYLRGFEKGEIIEAADTILSKNPRVNRTALEERLARINLAYDRGIHEGDTFELEYNPTIGTILRVNGNEAAVIPGGDFQAAYFGIWLSDFPLDTKLRDNLLSSIRNP